MTPLDKFLTLCRERYKRAKDASDTTPILFPDGEMGPVEKAITDSYAAQPALVEMVEELLGASDKEYALRNINALAEQALREMGEG